MKVQVYAEDWMICMGMVGLKRLLKDDVELTKFGLSFDPVVLERLPQTFFDYMINEFSIADRDYDRLKDCLRFAQNKEYFQQGLQQIRTTMSEQHKKVAKYFKDQVLEKRLREIVSAVKTIKQWEQYRDLEDFVEQYYEIMTDKAINEKLTLNYVKTVILGPLYGQPSFLNVSKNALSIEEQIDLFFRDYVKPVLLEAQFQDLLSKETRPDCIRAFLQENMDYKPFKDIYKEIKTMESINEIERYIADFPRCAILDDQLATTNFEEMIFSPLGVVANNFNWDLKTKQPVPLSVLAKLILFLASAGVVFYSRKEGFGGQGEYRTYAGFVMSDQTIAEIYRINESFKIKKENNNPFDEVIHDLLQDTQQKAKYVINQLFFLEIHSEYQSKKTLLDYYHMPPYVAEYFQKYSDKLEAIRPRELREAFTRSTLKGIDPQDIVFRCLQMAIKQNASGIGGYIAARELNRIRALKKGVKDMSKEDKRVYVVFKQGQELRNKLLKAGETRAASSEVYTASGNKKVNSIAYRLLNAAKAGSKKSFMDTLFRIHMAADEQISSIFLNILHEKDLSFEVVSSAFIAGLLSDDNRDNKEQEVVTHE